ncbi:serine hydrolase domain-containing protein [Sphingomonas sp.]|uniref:serine hydrolase domain-containing protein n=1 Tax=Sphingomonas sp. TaxID=28214 RepID=UPI001B1FA442|nr:serine hydrolase domain-containing protein [Sphingomonas sp.]MBO9711969.1 beta-lactamase family protein [Sphingomonas sp.]
MLPARPEDHGFDAARLARIDAYLKARYLDTGRLPHTQLLVAHEGEVVHFSHQGLARADSDMKVDETTLFRIASMTKPVTSLAFMMLVEECKVGLDTPVEQVLPEFKDVGVFNGGGAGVPFLTKAPAEPMRMIDLLRHTSGLTYSFQQRSNIDAAHREGKLENWYDNLTLDEFVAAVGKLPLEFSPGTAWNYSVSTDILGAVVQRVSGQGLGDFFRERIFAPLGMDDTFFVVPEDKVHRLADCWTLVPGKGRVMFDRAEESLWRLPPRNISGGGGLVSTALDYHRFCTMLLNKGSLGGVRLVSRKTIDLMTANHLPGGGDLASMSTSLFSETTNAGVGFGLGFAVTTDSAKTMIPGSVGEFYWGGMFSTAFFVDPVERITMVFMTQVSPSTAFTIRRELKTLIYSALST